jgi:hypothetical protein
MAKKGPKTLRGIARKMVTGDGRKNPDFGFSKKRGKKN